MVHAMKSHYFVVTVNKWHANLRLPIHLILYSFDSLLLIIVWNFAHFICCLKPGMMRFQLPFDIKLHLICASMLFCCVNEQPCSMTTDKINANALGILIALLSKLHINFSRAHVNIVQWESERYAIQFNRFRFICRRLLSYVFFSSSLTSTLKYVYGNECVNLKLQHRSLTYMNI